MTLPQLSGRVAVVTGASQGIGHGIALAPGDAGATIYFTGGFFDVDGSQPAVFEIPPQMALD